MPADADAGSADAGSAGVRFRKYPRTAHLEGSRLGVGDDPDHVRFSDLGGEFVVVEEKLDGANTGVRVVPGRGVVVQSRGHELTGGPRERQFELLKAWVSARASVFADVLGHRYVAFGEWVYAKHTLFYDRLAHFWFEFDVYDSHADRFLDTVSRRAMWAGTPVAQVPVIAAGAFSTLDALTGLVGPSLYISDRVAVALADAAVEAGQDPDVVAAHTDLSGLAEGLYIKVEAHGQVTRRLKWVRPTFSQTLVGSGSHWADRPIVANRVVDPDALWS